MFHAPTIYPGQGKAGEGRPGLVEMRSTLKMAAARTGMPHGCVSMGIYTYTTCVPDGRVSVW